MSTRHSDSLQNIKNESGYDARFQFRLDYGPNFYEYFIFMLNLKLLTTNTYYIFLPYVLKYFDPTYMLFKHNGSSLYLMLV